jgi:hypothetical protein
LREDAGRTRTDNFVLRTNNVFRRTKSAIETLWIDPDRRVLDLEAGAGARALVVAREDGNARTQDLPGLAIDPLLTAEAHALDAQVAEAGTHDRLPEARAVSKKLDVTPGCQNAEPIPDRVLASEASLVLEGFSELR